MSNAEKKKTVRNSSAFYLNLLGIKMELYNPNPTAPNKYDPEEKQDCVIRSICKLLDKSWKDVYKDLFDIGLSLGTMLESGVTYTQYLSRYGYVNISDMLYNEEDITTIGQFMASFTSGRYFISNNFHAVAYIDGVIYDNQAHFDELYDINYFLIAEHEDIFVNIGNKDYVAIMQIIKKKISRMEELSTSHPLMKSALKNLKVFKEPPKIEVGNFYKYNPIDDIYYLLINIDEDRGDVKFLVCTSKPKEKLIIKAKDTLFSTVGKHPVFTMNSEAFINNSDFELYDIIDETEVKSIMDYLRKEGDMI